MPHERFHYKTLDEVRETAKAQGAWLPLSEDIAPLFRPLTIAGKTLPNRLALQPMEGSDGDESGAPGPLTVRRYERFAKGGAALIWFEAVSTAKEARASRGQLYLTEENLPQFQRLVEHIKEIGLKENGFAPLLIMQATNSGRYAKPNGYPEPIIAYNNPLFEGDTPIDPARIVTDDQLKRYESLFEQTARLAWRAGFDGVDIKCCHRYLASELMSAYNREGAYGGCFENRARFLLNSVRAAKAGVPGECMLTCRMNAHDAYPYPYGFGVSPDGGVQPDLTESVRLAKILTGEMGMPLLNITIGNPYTNPHVNRPYDQGNYVPPEHPFTGLDRMMRCVSEIQHAIPDVPVIGSAYSYLRGFSANLAAGMVADGHAAIAGFGRMAFANPDFPGQLKETGHIDEKRVCIACGLCAKMLRAGRSAGCAVRDSECYRKEGLE